MRQFLPTALALLLFPLVFAGCTRENRDLTLAVSTEEPAPSIAESIRSLLIEREFSISIDVTTDPDKIVAAVRDRKVDLALVEESSLPIPGVVTLVPLYPSVLHVLHNHAKVPADFPALIMGSKVYAGPVGGAAHRLLLQLCNDFGVASDQFRLLDNPWTENPNVFFIFGGLLSADSIRQLDGYRLFSFADPKDTSGGSEVDGIVFKHHHLSPFLLPKNVYYTLSNDPIVTLSTRTVLIVHEDFNSEFALDIATQLFNNAQEIALSYPLVTRELNDRVDAIELMFPLHAGTRRYLDRDKPGFVERYVEVLALFFTIAITLLSTAFALRQHRSQVKKDRVDVYYSQLLKIRQDMEGTNTHTALRSYHQRALNVQHEVLTLLINERVAADASLMAFLSLSNQIINELDRRIGYKDDVVSG